MHRPIGARLAVPLLTLTSLWWLLTAFGGAAGTEIDGCRPAPDAIVCAYSGTTTSTSLASSTRPLRYLAVADGQCWFWSAYPPGLDSWDSANDQAIILTRFDLPECSGRVTSVAVTLSTEAWGVFRRFPLPPPGIRLTPDPGITQLPTRLHLAPPPVFSHSEVLPDGRLLEVAAAVERVWVGWGDGTPTLGMAPEAAVGDPGEGSHAYSLKTCPPQYRTNSIHGPKCHPDLEAYPVRITFEWVGSYRDGGHWVEMGSIDTASTIRYDVDEVLGVLTHS